MMINPVIEIATALNRLSVKLVDNSYVATVISAHLSSLDAMETKRLWKECRKVGFILEDAELVGIDDDSQNEIDLLTSQLNSVIDNSYLDLEVPDHLQGVFNPNELIGHTSTEQADMVLMKEPKSDLVFACLKNRAGKLLFCRKFESLDDFEEAVWAVA